MAAAILTTNLWWPLPVAKPQQDKLRPMPTARPVSQPAKAQTAAARQAASMVEQNISRTGGGVRKEVEHKGD